jgi:hypothetical protein
MALPSAAYLASTMSYAFEAQPFVNVPAKSSIILTNMEWAWLAQPFVIAQPPSGGVIGPFPTHFRLP